MQVAQAKDFLVRQTAEQALLDRVPLSDREKRIMCFTEGENSSEEISKLDDEFEANFDSTAYEAKISKLLNHAYFRLKKGNPETARHWDECIRLLSKGDHYIVVLWGQRFSTERPPHDSWKLFGTAMLVTVLGLAVMSGVIMFCEHYGLHWPNGPKSQTSIPSWIQRSIQWTFLIVGGGYYLYCVFLPWILGRPLPGLGKLILWPLSRRTKTGSEAGKSS
jgi:hypothetical protein